LAFATPVAELETLCLHDPDSSNLSQPTTHAQCIHYYISLIRQVADIPDKPFIFLVVLVNNRFRPLLFSYTRGQRAFLLFGRALYQETHANIESSPVLDFPHKYGPLMR